MPRWITCLSVIYYAVFVVNELSLRAEVDTALEIRIDRLIRQLGDDSFQQRQQAHRKLLEIGKPAAVAIRRATRHESAEVRERARALWCRLLGGEIQGVWRSDEQVLVIRGKHWWWGTINHLRPDEYDKCSFQIVHVTDHWFEANMLVGLGGRKGQVCKAIFRLDGDTLHYSGSYQMRPTGFKNGSGYDVQWKRVTGKLVP